MNPAGVIGLVARIPSAPPERVINTHVCERIFLYLFRYFLFPLSFHFSRKPIIPTALTERRQSSVVVIKCNTCPYDSIMEYPLCSQVA